MSCMICDRAMQPFMQKDFAGVYDLHVVHYERCSYCGFVRSATHAAMSERRWEALNEAAHKSYQGTGVAAEDPKWMDRLGLQTDALVRLAEAGILRRNRPWVDYACGDGTLADMLAQRGLDVRKFDRYMSVEEPTRLTHSQLHSTPWHVVINTSAIEHFLSREPIDEIMSLVEVDGTLALHTLVREHIPADPGWFYLLPVHVSLFTNRSMQILFDQYGFRSSIYHVESRLWFWFRDTDLARKRYCEQADPREGTWVYADAFVDYWKE